MNVNYGQTMVNLGHGNDHNKTLKRKSFLAFGRFGHVFAGNLPLDRYIHSCIHTYIFFK
jgi:hypothetical protein